jgi:low affinity Fe/Cu permease
LDELIKASERASNEVIAVEEEAEEDMDNLKEQNK